MASGSDPERHCGAVCLLARSLPEALVDLMLTVVTMCPSVCESSHFAVLLGAYSATLSVLGEAWGESGELGSTGMEDEGSPL